MTPAAGTYTGAQTLTATNTEAGVRFRYTRSTSATAPSNPTATNGFDLPAAGLSIASSAIVKVVAIDAAGNVSPVVQRNYTINTTTGDTTPPPAPAVNPTSGTYSRDADGDGVQHRGRGAAPVHQEHQRHGAGNPTATNGFDLPAGGLPVSASSVVKVARSTRPATSARSSPARTRSTHPRPAPARSC